MTKQQTFVNEHGLVPKFKLPASASAIPKEPRGLYSQHRVWQAHPAPRVDWSVHAITCYTLQVLVPEFEDLWKL